MATELEETKRSLAEVVDEVLYLENEGNKKDAKIEELAARVKELEAENEALARQLHAEGGADAAAVDLRQRLHAAERDRARLQQQVLSLEDQLSRERAWLPSQAAGGGGGGGVLWSYGHIVL